MTPRGATRGDGEQALALFDKLCTAQSWQPWRAFVCAVFGLAPRTAEGRALVLEATGRASLPATPAREAWAIVGRRGGKSRVAAVLAVFCACFRKYTLSPGERGRVVVLAADRRQAGVIYAYTAALLDDVPALAQLVTRRTATEIDLSNGVTIEILTADYRTLRGRTVVAAICDEVAFWEGDSSNTDTEVLAALRPAMATISNALLIGLSTPYARRGVLWSVFDRYFGKPGPVLVWRASSLTMNPTLDPALVEAARADDPQAAASEYDAEFRTDLERLFSIEALRAVTVPGRYELPATPGVAYVAFCDPSGGSSDSYTLAVAHKDRDDRAVLDLVREIRPPFSPEAVTGEFAAILRNYRIGAVTGDAYAGEFARSLFRAHGITYRVSSQSRSELYVETLARVNSGRVELLDHARTLAQFAGLERRTGRSGRDAVDHRQGQHDDCANAAAGALTLAVAGDDAAAWPTDFDRCEKAGMIPSFDLSKCALMGGHLRPDGSCGSCAGWRDVRPLYRAHVEQGGADPLHVFVRRHFTAHPIALALMVRRQIEAGIL